MNPEARSECMVESGSLFLSLSDIISQNDMRNHKFYG